MTDRPVWQPSASRAALESRAQLLAHVRGFFSERRVLEVETPVLGRHGVTDVNLDGIPSAVDAGGVQGGWLQTSPEYHMKRLLAAGSGAIYQICKAYRDGEAGGRHNPEFTMLEWYRPGFALDDLVQECLALFAELFIGAPSKTYRFRDLFRQVTGLDPLTANDSDLIVHAEA